jgi:hypothetical protein
LFPESREDVRPDPLLEAAMGGATGTDTGCVQGVALAPRTEDEKDGIQRSAIIDAGSNTLTGVVYRAAATARALS